MMFIKRQLAYRAQALKKIRHYFDCKGVLEVETPLAYPYPVSDPFIDAFAIDTQAGCRYLQTSPEYAMKRLLAAGSGSIYQICKAFRDDPTARIHHYEFTMLEWYRVGLDDWQLMDEVVELFQVLSDDIKVARYSYAELFVQYYGLNPHRASVQELLDLCKQYYGEIVGLKDATIADYLDLLFSLKIEPRLSQSNTLYMVYHYHRSQSALAQLVEDSGDSVAARFELFMNGVELGNGYHELTDASKLKQRFEQDLMIRAQQHKKMVPIDQELLNITNDIPACAGIAIGLDRVLMVLRGSHSLDEIMMRY